jgi:cytidine deaminase
LQKIFTFQTQIIKFDSSNDLTETQQNLMLHAQKACENSHSPYSGFQVGVAILLENGEIVQGANQENAAYPSGLCAERTAMYYVGFKYPDLKIKCIAITAQKASEPQLFLSVSPCGACRQAMLEYECRQATPIKILCSDENNSFYEFPSVESTLPLSFTSKSL